MSKNIYLDNLVSYSTTTYSNCYGKFINLTKIDINNEINKLKSNNSINEKGVFIQYNYIELATLMDFKYNELVLVYPISFNLENENVSWYNFLNSILLVLNNDYFNESNNIKKKYLDTLNEQLEKKIINNNLNDTLFENVINIININLIILNYSNDTKIKIYKNNNLENKYIIVYKIENDYLPVCNFKTKYYTDSSSFVKYLQEVYVKQQQQTKQNINLQINKEDEEDNESKTNKNDYYDEFQTVEDYTLHVSEAVDNKYNKELNSDNKKKKKNDKNIFISNKADKKKEEEEKDNNIIEDESVFNKTEIISKVEIIKINNSFKSTTKLEEIQNLCLKINIPTFAGSTKEGKPKNKTKTELLDEIKKYIG
jgi:hypothetical protein